MSSNIPRDPRLYPSAGFGARPLEWNPPRQAISQVPYLPGLDGMRALAVIAVMLYHANFDWMSGGFLGVEVFFVISGYLITLLLIGEHERTGRIDLKSFWLRRARRLLPALFVMLALLMIYVAIFKRDRLGELRGDTFAGLGYISNWYQIWVGQGYTSGADFAPLRHLWSLAVEEQFYLFWPIAMIGMISLGRRRLPEVSRWLIIIALTIAVLIGIAYHGGSPGDDAATWAIFGRDISRNDFLYLSTISRGTGLLLGAAFAMLWRPVAVMRGPLRNRGPLLDVFALVGVAGLGAMFYLLHVAFDTGRGDPWLFRGGFLLCAIFTIFVMAAVTHRGALAGRLLGNPVLNWIGTRSYGLYLFHWPIYQIIRGSAGFELTAAEFALAMAITVPITEASYRIVETPVRKQQVGLIWRRISERGDPRPRQALVIGGAVVACLFGFSAVSMAGAELKPNELDLLLAEGEEQTTDLQETLGPTSPTTVPGPTTAPNVPADPTQPGDTAAPTTAAPTTIATTTTLPDLGTRFAIGDSVMVGAAGSLKDVGFTYVDAEESRQFGDYLESGVLQQYAAAGLLPDVVLVHLGTNGTISESDAADFFTLLEDVDLVLVLTVWTGPRNLSWIEPNNNLIRSLQNQYANVEVGHWDALAPECKPNCFASSDGFHLNENGADYYAELIDTWIDSFLGG